MDLGKADKTLRNLKGKDASYTVALGDGICTRVAPNGTRTLELRARLNGTLQRYRLGHYPATTIAEAVAKAAEYRAMLREGLSPKVAEQRARGGDVPRNVTEAAERFTEAHLRVKTRERWAHEAERILKKEVLPVIGGTPLKQLQRTDLTALVEKKAKALRAKNRKGVMANRIAAVLSKLFGWCASQGWVPGDLARNLPKPAKETAKDRTLTPSEAGTLWLMLEECATHGGAIPQVHARVLQLLALTGGRCSEITSLTRHRIDVSNGVLMVTGGKTQASNRTLPLTAAARAVIELQAASLGEEEQDLLFPSPRAGKVIPSNEISRSVRDLVKLLKQARWTPHDLRRTAITVMAEAGIDGDIRRRVTGHQAADIHGRIYDRAARLEDMRAALLVVERWYTDAAAKASAGADQANVVSIRKGKSQ